MTEEIDTLRQQLLLAGKYGQSLMIENNELKDRSKEDELELNALRQQVQKLEDLNAKIIRDSNDDLDSAQKENVERINVLNREQASAKTEIIDLKTAKTKIRSELDEAHNIHQLEVQSLKKLIDTLKTEAKIDRQNVSEDNTEEMEQIIRELKCTNQELERKKDERDIALKMAMNKITNLQTEIKTSNAQREHIQSQKNTLEQELSKSQEMVDDLQLEVQQARMIPTGPMENIEGQGNSLFSEVEDQRKRTASELNILTSTYKDKIAKFDSMEAEIETLRNQNTNLKFKLSSMVVSENQNNRLINEVRTLREERDTLISLGYKKEHNIKNNDNAQPEISALLKENEELKQKISSIYLTKNIQHDSVRRLDSQLKVLEKQNNDLRDQLKEARLNQYQNLESDSTIPKVQNENIPPPSSKNSLPKNLKTVKETTTREYPRDEKHRELIQQFEKDYPEEDCKNQ